MKRVNIFTTHCLHGEVKEVIKSKIFTANLLQGGLHDGVVALPSCTVPVHYRKDEGEDDVHDMALHDGRIARDVFSLDVYGFQLLTLDSAIPAQFSWTDGKSVGKHVYPLIENYVAQATHASKVLVFDHILRDAEFLKTEENAGIKRDDPRATPFLSAPVNFAHNDYTVRSGFTRARQLLEPYSTNESLDRLLKSRFAIINFWYPLETVTEMPLAMCTWDSCRPADVRTIHIDYGHRTGETYRVHHNPAHKWVYFSHMNPREAILLKTFDSSKEVARFALHTGVPHTEPIQNVKSRRSLELRCLVFYDEFPDEVATNFVAPHLKFGYSESRSAKVTLLPASSEW